MLSKRERSPETTCKGERNMSQKCKMLRAAESFYRKADLAADHGDVDHAAVLREWARGIEVSAR